ncbi:MAG: NAD(+) synthase [Oscillospiraceae bacterium]|jgi:NAD+ synthase (glutamine-hydrolysing)|nr:NAD(+) synthase [Oscillospiraceae bacterium]
MKDGFIKVASGTPEVKVADVDFNREAVLRVIAQAEDAGVKILCLPELCLTGYTCGDLFFQEVLLNAARRALDEILERTKETDLLFALGLPVRDRGKLFNCAAVCCRGELLALVPKTYLPNFGEFYEKRWFEQGDSEPVIFRCSSLPELGVGVEICEDLWAPEPPSVRLARGGATVILNLSASDELAAKAEYRRALVSGQSARLVCGYIYADAGEGESSTDMVFAGHDLIAENGIVLAEKRFHTGLVISELDINHLVYERNRITTYPAELETKTVEFSLEVSETALSRVFEPLPFVPRDALKRAERCEEIVTIAALGLKKRVLHTGAKRLVLGLSGGLDSTLALLLSAKALALAGRPSSDILAVTMPGPGTTGRTRGNAEKLAEHLGAQLKVIPIGEAVSQHFRDIGHDESELGVVYENAQARERTQILMDLANAADALVVGTGDLSELALGWATYNGDHMSMYGVNSGIPKTLVRHLVAYFADTCENEALSSVLRDVLATPVSPELLPAEGGVISQKTEDLVGPYELHDFFLYRLIRRGEPPRKVLRLAALAFAGVYDEETIARWLRVFVRRFFAQQFKRSALPDGPKVGTLSLSPRGDWRMPSDASSELWVGDAEDR